jgi:hypothetical protein
LAVLYYKCYAPYAHYVYWSTFSDTGIDLVNFQFLKLFTIYILHT